MLYLTLKNYFVKTSYKNTKNNPCGLLFVLRSFYRSSCPDEPSSLWQDGVLATAPYLNGTCLGVSVCPAACKQPTEPLAGRDQTLVLKINRRIRPINLRLLEMTYPNICLKADVSHDS